MKIEIVKETETYTRYWVMVNDSYCGLSNCFQTEQEADNYLAELVQLHNDNNLPKTGKSVLKTITL